VPKRAIALAIGDLHDGGRALAIPAFARRYQTACTTCTSSLLSSNSQGQAFREAHAERGSRQDADSTRRS